MRQPKVKIRGRSNAILVHDNSAESNTLISKAREKHQRRRRKEERRKEKEERRKKKKKNQWNQPSAE